MIVIGVSFLLSIHVWILLDYIELITSDSLIVLLYSSNMILILAILGRKVFFSVKKSVKEEVLCEIANDLKEAVCTRSGRDSKHSCPNLYIKRWKENNLDRSVEYPLDRNAYLSAKYTWCGMDCCFLLKNSQLKLLVKKAGLPSHEQILYEPHPCKMVTPCFDIYTDRRSAFYRKRRVISGDRKQYTRPGVEELYRGVDGDELEISQCPSPYSSVVDTRTRSSSFDYSPASRADRDAGVVRVWRKISRAFSR